MGLKFRSGQQLEVCGFADDGGSVVGAQRPHDLFEVGFNCRSGNGELATDFFIGFAFRQQVEH